jgi:hypothetical protein
MRPRFERLYVKKYPPEAYRKEVQAMVRVLQDRYGHAAKKEAGPETYVRGQARRKRNRLRSPGDLGLRQRRRRRSLPIPT